VTVSIQKFRIIVLVSNLIEYWSNYSIRNFEYLHSTNLLVLLTQCLWLYRTRKSVVVKRVRRRQIVGTPSKVRCSTVFIIYVEMKWNHFRDFSLLVCCWSVDSKGKCPNPITIKTSLLADHDCGKVVCLNKSQQYIAGKTFSDYF